MANFKTVFVGKPGSGKTQLIRQISSPSEVFQENSATTVGVDYLVRNTSSEHVVEFWDLAGHERYESLSKAFLRGADVFILCIDLTEEFDEIYIRQKIELFQEFSPDAPIILVGTKSDIPAINYDNFEKIKAFGLFSKQFLTSAKEKSGNEELFSLFSELCAKKNKKELDEELVWGEKSSWGEALEKLYASLLELPEDKKSLIKNELDILSNRLTTEPTAIGEFTNHCEEILEGKYSTVFKEVLSLAAVALVTVVAALLGFGIGFACGWWTGPGAVFTGVAAGYAAASTVTAASIVLGITAGGLTAFGLFSTSKEMTAINEFTAEITPVNAEINIS